MNPEDNRKRRREESTSNMAARKHRLSTTAKAFESKAEENQPPTGLLVQTASTRPVTLLHGHGQQRRLQLVAIPPREWAEGASVDRLTLHLCNKPARPWWERQGWTPRVRYRVERNAGYCIWPRLIFHAALIRAPGWLQEAIDFAMTDQTWDAELVLPRSWDPADANEFDAALEQLDRDQLEVLDTLPAEIRAELTMEPGGVKPSDQALAKLKELVAGPSLIVVEVPQIPPP